MKISTALKAWSLGASLTAAALFTASPVEAQTLKGRFGISGDANITRTNEISPRRTVVRPTSANVDTATGDFASIKLRPRFPLVRPLRLTETGPGIYEEIRINNYVVLGRAKLGGKTGRLTFDTDDIVVNRSFSNRGLNPKVKLNSRISGVFEFKGKALNSGFATFSASNYGGSESYELTLETVPEPLTIFGTLAAVGLLGVGKREFDKVKSVKRDEVT